ncbi:MAG: division plane positioning ATPase MipZ [Rickettsiaceae bacterium]|nr:division plane positioning ATPase MipZ [Rickettsiaceae bacterium]
MKNKKLPHVFVIGNEKGGAGKTTCSMHLIAGLLDKGFKVSSIDADCRQKSLTRYFENRRKYNELNPSHPVDLPTHYLLEYSSQDSKINKEIEEQRLFEEILSKAKEESDFVVIDTPGTYSFLSSLAHSHADTVITPINDSFVDIDVLAKVDGSTMKVIGPSIYSQMVWEQKLEKAKRGSGSIDWVVMRNRLGVVDAINKQNVGKVLDELAKRVSFKQAPGFGERVIFRELFLQGLTLIDLKKANYSKSFSLSHIAARQEIKAFFDVLEL